MGSFQLRIVRDPSPEAWSRVQRYASWMRHVHMDGWFALGDDALTKFRLNTPVDGWFPVVHDLFWRITELNLPYLDLFFSPHLKKISIFPSLSWSYYDVPRGILLAIASALSTLPTSALQTLLISPMMAWADLEDAISSVALRCGPSLMEFIPPTPLSDAATNHLIQLPHLRSWHVEGPPPTYSPSPLPLVFPPLTEFTLADNAAHKWFSLFERLERGAPATQGTGPLSKTKETLETLEVMNFLDSIIDVSFVSTIKIFRNLVRLRVGGYCYNIHDEGQCTFKLNDDDVTELAMALPHLESLLLGHPCFENTCATTVACLLPVSVRCVKLQQLEIHFNTTNIVDDFKNALADPRPQESRPPPRCTLSCLDVSQIPLTLDEPGFETVANGMIDIFPDLESIAGGGRAWARVSRRIAELREI